MRPLPLLAVTAIALSIAACGVAVDPIVVPKGCPEQPVRGPELYADVSADQVIDDFEDMDHYINAVAARSGTWNSMSNGTSSILSFNPSSDCAARGRWAGNFMGQGFSPHGASVTAYFIAQGPFPVAYNATIYNYTGISFWAAIGTPTSDGRPFPVELGLSTLDTVTGGGFCTACFDYYRTTAQLTTTWQRFVYPFTALAQSGEGKPQGPVPLRSEALVGFLIWPTETQFDIWIDDLRFEK
jgi:hypothetical protein